MSREAFERIVRAYEEWDPGRMYEDRVCLHVISKVFTGRSETERQDVQECETCKTLKRYGQYKLEVESGPCDSEMSAKMLNGVMEGEAVAAYAEATLDQRGGMSGRFKWGGGGATVIGRSMAILNAGTHHDPIRDCEECHQPYHAEGWLRGAVVDGDCTGARVNGAVSYNVDPIGPAEDSTGAAIIGVFEGLLIIQCDD